MGDIYLRRYAEWRAAGFDQWEALRFCFSGPVWWNWFDPVAFGQAKDFVSYPWEVDHA
jgi:hypothetical protein